MNHEFTQSDARLVYNHHPDGWAVQVRPALYLRASGEVNTTPTVWECERSAKAAVTQLLTERSRVNDAKHKIGFFGRVMSSTYKVY